LVLPSILNVHGKAKWELQWDDTAEIWAFGDYKHYSSLITLCFVFGVPSPKHTLDGAAVPAAFFEGRIADIKEYCMDDVLADMRVYRRMKSLAEITEVIRR
jgi:hypothetical protein